MAQKRRKVIKRVYESGRETTLSHKKQSKQSSSSTKPSARRSTISLAMKQKATGKKKIPRPQPVQREKKEAKTAVVQPPKFSDQQDLSANYGTTYLNLMVKDPFWVYAYWEIAPDSLHSLMKKVANQHLKDAKTILRMYDVTLLDFNGSNANSYFDIEVGPRANNWYISLWNDSVSYVGEIGIKLSDGRFFALARSNAAHTPRKNYSIRNEQMWMKVTDEADHKPYVAARPKSGYQTKQISPAPKPRRTIYLTEDDIRRYYSKLSPLLRDIISARLDEVYGKKAGNHKLVLEENIDINKNPLLPKEYFIRKVIAGASESLVFVGASEQISQQESSASESLARPDKRKFFFELNTEIIVYGRTEADAKVYLGDKEVPLRSDGTFSLRLALPDGNLPLEFRAESADKKEVRKISTYIDRITRVESSE